MLGGSFNPAHAGHLHVAERARRLLRLDQVWLMVSPGNPLKSPDDMASFANRFASARRVADGRRVIATGIEAAMGTRYSVDTVAGLLRRFPRARFVWLMGADNLGQLPRWQRWTKMTRDIAFAVLPRPGYNASALRGRAATRLAWARHSAREAAILSRLPPPAWIFVPTSQHPASATAIRQVAKEQSHRQKPALRAAAL